MASRTAEVRARVRESMAAKRQARLAAERACEAGVVRVALAVERVAAQRREAGAGIVALMREQGWTLTQVVDSVDGLTLPEATKFRREFLAGCEQDAADDGAASSAAS